MKRLFDLLKLMINMIKSCVKTVNGILPDENGDVKIEVGGGLPSVSAPHQMLVTDADGKTVWEERTHYASPIRIEWDGSLEEKETASDGFFIFAKLSDAVYGTEELLGGTMYIANAEELLGFPNVINLDESNVFTHNGNTIISMQKGSNSPIPMLLSTRGGEVITGTEDNVMTDVTAGTYALYGDLSALGMSGLVYMARLEAEGIRRINRRFIGDGIPQYGTVGEVHVIEWDGNTDGLETFRCNDFPYYKVSDFAEPFEHVVASKTRRSDAETYNEYLKGENCYDIGSAIVVTMPGQCKDSNGMTFTVDSAGVYFLKHDFTTGTAWCEYAEIDTRRENSILYLTNPSGVKYAITADDYGTLTATEITD